jgi:KaiC/GvpD/RAD55 family RecA-like ATPase
VTDFIDKIQKNLDQIEAAGVGRYYKPLASAADEFIHFAENPDQRIHTGIPIFDEAIRGVAPGELLLINGFAHSGKTVLATEILMANTDNPMVLFTPDETRPAVLTKLAAADTGVGAEELERRIYRRDETARELLIEVADKYHQLAVYDESVTLHMMEAMLKEAEEAFGKKPKGVVFDYAEQLNESLDTRGKLDALKRFGKQQGVSMIVLHQTSRSAGAGGQRLGIDSGSYGGEQQSIFIITVRRKINYYRDRLIDLEYKLANASNPTMQQRYQEQIEDIIHWEIPKHLDTVSLALVKNKRPPMRLVDEVDFKIEQTSGRVTLIEDEIPPPEDLFQKEILDAGSGRELLG